MHNVSLTMTSPARRSPPYQSMMVPFSKFQKQNSTSKDRVVFPPEKSYEKPKLNHRDEELRVINEMDDKRRQNIVVSSILGPSPLQYQKNQPIKVFEGFGPGHHEQHHLYFDHRRQTFFPKTTSSQENEGKHFDLARETLSKFVASKVQLNDIVKPAHQPRSFLDYHQTTSDFTFDILSKNTNPMGSTYSSFIGKNILQKLPQHEKKKKIPMEYPLKDAMKKQVLEMIDSFNDQLLNTGLTDKFTKRRCDQNTSSLQSPKYETPKIPPHQRSRTLLLTSQRSSKDLQLPLVYGSSHIGNAHLISIYKETDMQTSPEEEDEETAQKLENDKKNPPAKVQKQKKKPGLAFKSRTSLGGANATLTMGHDKQKRVTELSIGTRNLSISPEPQQKTQETLPKYDVRPLNISSVTSPQNTEAIAASNALISTFASKHYRLKQVPQFLKSRKSHQIPGTNANVDATTLNQDISNSLSVEKHAGDVLDNYESLTIKQEVANGTVQMHPISIGRHLNQFGQTQFQLKFRLLKQHLHQPILMQDSQTTAGAKFMKYKGGNMNETQFYIDEYHRLHSLSYTKRRVALSKQQLLNTNSDLQQVLPGPDQVGISNLGPSGMQLQVPQTIYSECEEEEEYDYDRAQSLSSSTLNLHLSKHSSQVNHEPRNYMKGLKNKSRRIADSIPEVQEDQKHYFHTLKDPQERKALQDRSQVLMKTESKVDKWDVRTHQQSDTEMNRTFAGVTSNSNGQLTHTTQ